MPIDNTYLWHGHMLAGVRTKWMVEPWAPMMSSVGLDIVLPLKASAKPARSVWCRRLALGTWSSVFGSAFGSGCGRCWKCFHVTPCRSGGRLRGTRNSDLLGQATDQDRNTRQWWINEHDRWDLIPDLEHLKEPVLSAWTTHYPRVMGFLTGFGIIVQQAVERSIPRMPDDAALIGTYLFPHHGLRLIPLRKQTFVHRDGVLDRAPGPATT